MAKLKVHPSADIFPMMSEEELADLAEDIKVNGLIHPIIVDADNQLIDGRNRYAACQIAGVEPKFESLNGHDPLAFIAGVNLKRRNLSKSQQAMALAKLYPEPEKGGRGKRSQFRESLGKTMENRLSQARQVLAYSPPTAQDVLNGTISLDEALQKVVSEKTQAEGNTARMERLRKNAPDLADLVVEERISLLEATAAWNKREHERRATYEAGLNALDQLIEFPAHVTTILAAEEVRRENEEPLAVRPIDRENIKSATALLEKFCRRSEK